MPPKSQQRAGVFSAMVKFRRVLASRNAENTLTGMSQYLEKFGQVREKCVPYLRK
ncbi:mitochondrial carrier protein [Aspergillus luchuensis]|uniref:Mitochondrial carrier protein n=1 Tax=Aspergillus kawachii TaxID=1069201 RepID=A0A146FR16_ASPKA|nr:mitochondrial carrier protein [Aspergillus luchuensis]